MRFLLVLILMICSCSHEDKTDRYNLGTICDDGNTLLIEFLESETKEELDIAIDKIEKHCDTCKGCRESFYTEVN